MRIRNHTYLRRRGRWWVPAAVSCFLLSTLAFSQAGSVTEQALQDAILGRTTVDASLMDLNADGKVDVADVVYLIKHPLQPSLPKGEHVGTMVRTAKIAGQQGGQGTSLLTTFGKIPFVLNITSNSPLQGEIDNSGGETGSLYFPKEKLPVTFTGSSGSKDLEAKVVFTTVAPNLAPEDQLTRTITFTGSFTDEQYRLITGTYEEKIEGFHDHQGNEQLITLNGQFTLIINRL